MADRMCCWSNCEKETVAVRVTVIGSPDERLVFCCLDHAANKLTAIAERKRALSRVPQEVATPEGGAVVGSVGERGK